MFWFKIYYSKNQRLIKKKQEEIKMWRYKFLLLMDNVMSKT